MSFLPRHAADTRSGASSSVASFWFSWIGAHIIAFLMAIPLFWLTRSQLGLREVGPAAFFTLFACSVLLGILQGLFINSRLPGAWWERWALVTVLSMLALAAAAIWLGNKLTQQGYPQPALGFYDYLPLGGALIGGGLGIAQWILLRKSLASNRAWIWVPTIMIAGVLVSMLLLSALADNIIPLRGSAGWVVRLSLAAISTGALSGISLSTLINRGTRG